MKKAKRINIMISIMRYSKRKKYFNILKNNLLLRETKYDIEYYNNFI